MHKKRATYKKSSHCPHTSAHPNGVLLLLIELLQNCDKARIPEMGKDQGFIPTVIIIQVFHCPFASEMNLINT